MVQPSASQMLIRRAMPPLWYVSSRTARSEEHTSELQSLPTRRSSDLSFQQIDGMIPLHDGTALGEPDVDTKSYASLMVCFIKNRRYYARPVLRKDLCEVLRGFIGVKQPAGARIDLRVTEPNVLSAPRSCIIQVAAQ